MSNRIFNGDSFAVLPTIESESHDACVTDGPYGIRFMGKAWDGADIEKRTADSMRKDTLRPDGWKTHCSPAMSAGRYEFSLSANRSFQTWTEAWAREMFRILKPGAYLVSFSSPRTYHRMVCGIEDAGFEIRDQLGWLFGSGFPKSSNQTGEWKGWGTALKPGWEPIVLARKPMIGTVPENLAAHRTGALHIDACRVPFAGAADEKEAKEAKEKNRHTQFESGPTENNVFGKFAKPREDYDASGRWPANIVHDGSPEVLACFPMLTAVRGAAGLWSGEGGGLNGNSGREAYTDTGSAARFFYCAKASVEDREAGLEFMKLRPLAYGNQAQAEVKRGNTDHSGTSGMNTVKMRANTHPTVKPTDLMRWLCRLVTPAGGCIIDPFFGSGSTGRGAVLEGYTFTGIERETEYAPIARARVAQAAGEMFAQIEMIDARETVSK